MASASTRPSSGAAIKADVGFHYGWVVVGAAFSVLFVAYGVQFSFGLFFTALVAEFGWSRASLSGVFSLYAGAYAFLGLIAGRLTDRWGPRTVVATGALLYGLGLALSGRISWLGGLYLTYLLAAAGMSTAYVPCNATVVKWFTARRGLAVGIAMAGASLGTFACPPLIALLLARTGWRTAYGILGGVLFVLIAGLALLLVREPAARGLLPYGGVPDAVPRPEATGTGWGPGEALRHPSFWGLLGVYTATWIPVFLPLVHLAPLAQDLGLGPAVGAAALSALGIGAVAGRLAMGALSDRIGRRATLALALGLQALSFLTLALARSAPPLLGSAALFGYCYGAISSLMPAIVGDYYGPAHAGSLVGIIFGVAGPAGAVGPLLAGWIFDASGAYTWAFLISALTNLIALGLLAVTRPPARVAGPGLSGGCT